MLYVKFVWSFGSALFNYVSVYILYNYVSNCTSNLYEQVLTLFSLILFQYVLDIELLFFAILFIL